MVKDGTITLPFIFSFQDILLLLRLQEAKFTLLSRHWLEHAVPGRKARLLSDGAPLLARKANDVVPNSPVSLEDCRGFFGILCLIESS